jgi:cytochrome P450
LGRALHPAIDLLDHDLFAEREPWEVFDRLRREAPVYWQDEPGDGRGFWNVTRYRDVVTVLKDVKRFSSELGGVAQIADMAPDELEARRNFMELDPPRHTAYRRLFAPDFTPRAVGRWEEWLQGLVGDLLDDVLPPGELDWVESVARPIPIRVLGHIMGIPVEHHDRLVELGDRMLVDTEPAFVGDRAFAAPSDAHRLEPFGSPDAAELCGLGRRYYAERRSRPQDDVLSLIANARIDGCPLDERQLDNTFAIMVVAGNETTRQAIALGTLALIEHPDELARLRAEPELMTTAVEELLRFTSPVWHFRRTATSDTEIAGQAIRAGDKVVVWFASANRDPDVFPDPDRLDLGRKPNDHAVFGRGGPHFCLGAHLARLELQVLLTELLPRVERIELAGRPVRVRSNFANGLRSLPVRVTPARVLR